MKKITPPILFLTCTAFMIAINNVAVMQEIIPSPFHYIGFILISTGIIITIHIRNKFDKMNTEIHTFKNPRKLVTNGLFKVSRNPIYLGFTISLIGVWVFLGSFLPIFGCLFFILITNYWYIPTEEKTMEKIFGYEYKIYKSKVRRWI